MKKIKIEIMKEGDDSSTCYASISSKVIDFSKDYANVAISGGNYEQISTSLLKLEGIIVTGDYCNNYNYDEKILSFESDLARSGLYQVSPRVFGIYQSFGESQLQTISEAVSREGLVVGEIPEFPSDEINNFWNC